ncbi:MAG: HhoA/HhoB/HtrA family serine endopeptidase [Phormidesmis sp.]
MAKTYSVFSHRRNRFLVLGLIGVGAAIALSLTITPLHIAKSPLTLGASGLNSSGLGSSALKGQSAAANGQPATSPGGSSSSGLIAAHGPDFISNIVQQVGPAVVRIDSTRTVSANSAASDGQTPSLFNDPFFQQFFGSQVPGSQTPGTQPQTPQTPQTQVQRGEGSGFIVNSNGQIITNAHVVDGADQVKVTLKDGRSFEGKVLGSDPVTDVAVIKVEAKDLPTVPLGDSDQLLPGTSAIAIGNPLGLDNTVTAGIISATSRSSSEVGIPDQRTDFLQTDAAINPGNSGGPLLNDQGQVIGMNTAIIQGTQGLGFAIPINTVERVATELMKNGKIEHAYMGVQMLTLTPQVKEQFNSDPNSGLSVNEDAGVLVVKVVPDSPAAKAGVRAGDVIHEVGGEAITTADQLQQKVDAGNINSNLQLKVDRNGQPQTLSVKLQALPTQASDATSTPGG